MICIRKKSGEKKDAFRIKDNASIPVFLKEAVRIQGDKVILTCAEGEEICSLGEVITYEKSNSVQSGWNCWVVGNAGTVLEEKDGQFFTKPLIIKAELMTQDYPTFIDGVELTYIEDENAWTMNTFWGMLKGTVGNSYWVLYGNNNGKLDVAILQVSEKSFKEYFVCDDEENMICSLSEYHQQQVES